MTLWLWRHVKLPALAHVQARQRVRLLSVMLRTFSEKNTEKFSRTVLHASWGFGNYTN